MSSLVPFVWAAGVAHLGIAAANFVLPAKLRYRENLSKVSPIIRQIFIVHAAYIVGVLVIFGLLCFFCAPELVGGSRLGRFLSASLALFWLSRSAIQFFYYDPELKRQNRLADIAFRFVFLFLAGVFGLSAMVAPK